MRVLTASTLSAGARRSSGEAPLSMRVLTTSPDITDSRRFGGHPWHESAEAYFRDVLGLASWRTAYRRLAIGRMLTSGEERDRAGLRVALAKVGLAKAAMVVPAIERLGQWRPWLKVAGELSVV